MHAHLKRAHGEEASLGYCPLDLFSGDAARVTRALHTLWDIWIDTGAKVNNLRVFVGGQDAQARVRRRTSLSSSPCPGVPIVLSFLCSDLDRLPRASR